MVSPRALSVLVALLSSACFSPQGGETSPGSESAANSSTGATTGDSGTSLNPTATGTTGPTTGDSTTAPPDPTTGPTTTTTSGPTTATTSPDTDATTDTSSTTDVPATCGNGVEEPGEECDDGNDIHDDECSNKCTLPGCGDGILHADEECDEASDDCVACKRSSMRVFVTSAAVLPVLGGLMGADATCQQAADQAGVQGRFRAWLSTKDVSAHNRLVHSARPYMRLDGEIVATHWADLIDGSLFAAISVDETGKSVPAQMGCGVCPVWTATYTNGAAYMDSCTNWGMLSALTSAGVGECSFQNQQWTDGCGTLACNKTARLYCLEQGLAP